MELIIIIKCSFAMLGVSFFASNMVQCFKQQGCHIFVQELITSSVIVHDLKLKVHLKDDNSKSK